MFDKKNMNFDLGLGVYKFLKYVQLYFELIEIKVAPNKTILRIYLLIFDLCDTKHSLIYTILFEQFSHNLRCTEKGNFK